MTNPVTTGKKHANKTFFHKLSGEHARPLAPPYSSLALGSLTLIKSSGPISTILDSLLEYENVVKFGPEEVVAFSKKFEKFIDKTISTFAFYSQRCSYHIVFICNVQSAT